MKTTILDSKYLLAATSIGLAVTLACGGAGDAGSEIALDSDDIGGVVTSEQGPEAGVWVIAETQDLPTPFAQVVVTNAEGHYVLPDLPEASYELFVRGYGLVDSERVSGSPGQHINLDAVIAPDGLAAAAVYPPAYWMSLLEIPEGDIPAMEVTTAIKNCLQCHPIGNQGTREIPAHLQDLPSAEAWEERIKVGGMGEGAMTGMIGGLGPQA